MRLLLSRKSLWNRRWTAILTLMSLVISIMLVLGINHVRTQVKTGFSNTLSGTDLIVGARGGSLNLLLYSVFHMGNATHNIRWNTYEELAKHRDVEWLIPIALGDSHKGFRVVATTPDFFAHYAYGQKQNIAINQGAIFSATQDVVLGSAVAKQLNYQIGDALVLAHGLGKVTIARHDDAPFIVSGILAPTGTPVDNSLYISLAGMQAIHRNWQSGVHIPAASDDAQDHHHHAHTHDAAVHAKDEHDNAGHNEKAHAQSLSAILIGLKSRAATFKVQRQINQYKQEPLQAIVPGLALAELWQLMRNAELAFNAIALLVVAASLLGMTTSLLTAMNERQREFSILRALGAGPLYLFLLVITEVVLLCLLASVIAVVVLTGGLWIFQSWIVAEWGLHLSANILSGRQLYYLLSVLLAAVFLSLWPAFIACRRALHDGLAIRI
jgi:putative ABC transport system permease protein